MVGLVPINERAIKYVMEDYKVGKGVGGALSNGVGPERPAEKVTDDQ